MRKYIESVKNNALVIVSLQPLLPILIIIIFLLACHISKTKDVAATKPSHYSRPDSEPWKNSGWRQTSCSLPSLQPLQSLPTVHIEGIQDGEKQDMTPESWGAFQRNDFSEPSLLHLPTHRKVLNSLTWGIWFSLINSNLLMFRLPGLCCKNSYIY